MIIQQNIQPQTVYVHKSTTNKSFLEMYYYLKDSGRTNCTFHLSLIDPDLAAVDPRDPRLNTMMKAKVLRECMCNYWYFIREVVRIPVSGGEAGGGDKYLLHRGNLALNFGFTLNWNMMFVICRQAGKSIGAVIRYLWCFCFGTTNSEVLFANKKFDDSKMNLARLKEIRNALPEYLRMNNLQTQDGKKVKVKDAAESLENAINRNKIVTIASARNKTSANSLGRGRTVPMIWIDEFAFVPYNDIMYKAMAPAFKTASMNARKAGSPYGILLTTTPGDLTTSEGRVGFQFKNNATKFKEEMYDMSYDQISEIINANTTSNFVYIEFTYQQVGRDENWFREIVVDMQKNWADIRREVLLEWSSASDNSPFTKEDLNIVKSLIKEPKSTVYIMGKYPFDIYEDIDFRYPPIIGVDVSGGFSRDSSAIVVIDSRTTNVTANFRCNWISPIDLAKVIYELVTKYMPNAVVNVERNGGFGASVIAKLINTKIKRNLYFEIKDKIIEERVTGYGAMQKRSARTKVYGLDNTHAVREKLMEILRERMAYHKDKFVSPYIMEELETLEVKRNGRVEHTSDGHDDVIFAYLMALYVWYEGKDLMEIFGIMKQSLQTDQDDVDEYEDIESKFTGVAEELTISSDDLQDQYAQLGLDQYGRSLIKSMKQFEAEEYIRDQECLNNLLQNKAVREAWASQTHISNEDLERKYARNQQYTIPDNIWEEFYN